MKSVVDKHFRNESSAALNLRLHSPRIYFTVMASLRQRVLGTPKSSHKKQKEESPPRAEDVRLAPVSKILKDGEGKHPKSRKKRNGFIFFLGGLFGIVAAGFFAQKSDLIEFPEMADLSMDSIMDVLPAGFARDLRDLAVCF